MLKEKRTFIGAVIISLTQLFIWSCMDETSSDTPDSYDSDESLLAEGWNWYAAEEYDSALSTFRDVNERNAQATEAYIGKGWSYLRLGKFNSASTEFNVVLSLATELGDNTSKADGYAGLFLITLTSRYNAETDPEEDPTEDDLLEMMIKALDMGENALLSDPSYSTTHDPGFASDELHESLAHSYIYLHRFQEALGHVKAVYGNTVLDDGDFSITTITDTLTAWVDYQGDMQVFGLSDDSDLETLTLSSSSVVSVTDIKDVNNNSVSLFSVMFDYLYEGDQVNITPTYDFPVQTDTVMAYEIAHALPNRASDFFRILSVTKKGVYSVESVYKMTTKEVTRWWRVDTTIVPIDTSLATDTYSGSDTCCYFFSTTDTVDTLKEVTGEPWTSVNKSTFLPGNPDDTVFPSDITVIYNYNIINLPDEPTPGDMFIVTYKYGQYEVSYDNSDNFIGYLKYLNNKVSVSFGD